MKQVNEAHIDVLSRRFYASGYDIRSFLEDIFTSGWFYDKRILATRLKSPVELMAGIMRILPMQITVPEKSDYLPEITRTNVIISAKCGWLAFR